MIMYKVLYGKREKEFLDFGKALLFAQKKASAVIWYHGVVRNEIVCKYDHGCEVKDYLYMEN
jgi:hypothetical protein